MGSATRSVNEQAADGLNCSGSKWLPLDGQELQFGDLLDKLHWSLEFAVQAALAVTLDYGAHWCNARNAWAAKTNN